MSKYTANFNPKDAQAKVDALLPELAKLGWAVSHAFENHDPKLFKIASDIDNLYDERHPHFPVFGNGFLGDWECENSHGFTPRSLRAYFTVDNPPPAKLVCPICGGEMHYDESA